MKKRIISILVALIMALSVLPAVQAAQIAEDDLTEQGVYEAMIALQADYPEGTPWTNDNFYAWHGGIYSGGYGCAGFAFMLSDAAFGTLPARKITTIVYEDVHVGDIVRINNNTHSVIILEVHDDHVVIAEGNFNSSVHWGRTLTKAKIESSDYVLTRWPEGFFDGPLGDVDCNGVVDMSDISMLFGFLNGGEIEISAKGMTGADANKDGSVNVMDITAIFNIIANS